MLTREHDQSRYRNTSHNDTNKTDRDTNAFDNLFNDQFDELFEYLASVFYQSNKEFCNVIYSSCDIHHVMLVLTVCVTVCTITL